MSYDWLSWGVPFKDSKPLFLCVVFTSYTLPVKQRGTTGSSITVTSKRLGVPIRSRSVALEAMFPL
jgi:hypothetical protein